VIQTVDPRGPERCANATDPARIAVVLSAGGLRGAAHAGVLRALVRHGIPVHALVGVSAGAIVAAFYAAVGLDLEEMIADAAAFRGRHLLVQSVKVRCGPGLALRLNPWCGVIPDRLRQLEAASFARLHHGVRRLAIVCHDVTAGEPRDFGTGLDESVTLSDVVRASASIPYLFPPVSVSARGQTICLSDGGTSDPLPLSCAARPALGSTHFIVSDCCRRRVRVRTDPRVVWIRPRIPFTGLITSPYGGLLATVRAGQDAVTADVLREIQSWLAVGRRASSRTVA
jgi:NTE family protein